MKLVRRILVVVISLVILNLSGCIHIQPPEKPLVDVDVGSDSDRSSASDRDKD